MGRRQRDARKQRKRSLRKQHKAQVRAERAADDPPPTTAAPTGPNYPQRLQTYARPLTRLFEPFESADDLQAVLSMGAAMWNADLRRVALLRAEQPFQRVPAETLDVALAELETGRTLQTDPERILLRVEVTQQGREFSVQVASVERPRGCLRLTGLLLRATWLKLRRAVSS